VIQAHFTQVKAIIDEYTKTAFVLEVTVNYETRPGEQGYIKGTMTFIDGSRFHFREYLDVTGGTTEKLAYSYHFEDTENRLVFRYDNARHKPPLGFSEHKHTGADNIIQASAPTVDLVLAEIAQMQGWI
jgi:hypothetical protein